MTESFLHYIWQFQLFDCNNLIADDGQPIEIIKTGQYNTNAGPDFFNSILKLDGTIWAGNVEIHIQSSEWKRHKHQTDPSYNSCILHVVFENDQEVFRMDGTRIPTIELKNKFSNQLWNNYLHLISSSGWISCQGRINEADAEAWKITHEKMIHERFEKRKQQIFIALKGNKEDWEETFYQSLARNFGFQLNAIPFEMLARSLPLKIIRKEYKSAINIEALLFGQAGMLNLKENDAYTNTLLESYNYLSKKYLLQNIAYSSWKFLRLRPVNFPAVRLAQLAALLEKNLDVFNDIIENDSLKNIYSLFNVQASEYWNTHFHFYTPSPQTVIKKLGISSVNNILINTVVPFLFAWGKYTGNNEIFERAYSFLMKISPENNSIIRHWDDIGIKADSAMKTQSLIHLKTEYCSEKKCLNCPIGKKIIEMNTDI